MIIGTPEEAAAVLAPLFAPAKGEIVAVIHLDGNHRLLAVSVEKTGGLDEVELPIGAILRRALRIGSEAIIVAHNHPSGDPNPSSADEAATQALASAAAAADVRLRDHIIFGGGDCRSFRSLGLL